MMAHRNSSRTDGLRQLLLDRHRKSMERWHIPGRRCEFEDALVSGKAVVVSSARNMGSTSRVLGEATEAPVAMGER